MTDNKYYRFEIIDAFGDEYIVNAFGFQDALNRLHECHGLQERDISEIRNLGIVE